MSTTMMKGHIRRDFRFSLKKKYYDMATYIFRDTWKQWFEKFPNDPWEISWRIRGIVIKRI